MRTPAKVVSAAVGAAMALLVGVEGIKYKAYQDTGGVWTICYGYAQGVRPGQTATPQQCWSMLQTEAQATANAIVPYLPATINPNQLAALISFCYNVGNTACRNSTMFRLINEGNWVAAAKQFDRWTFVKKMDCKVRSNNCYGIVLRRQAERTLFEKPYAQ